MVCLPRRIVFVSCIIGVIGVSCGNPDRGTKASATGTINTGTISNGFAVSDVPLGTRRDPLILSAGDGVLVFGGSKSDGDGNAQYLDDGALYNEAKGSWTDIPTAPFSEPLYQASGVWNGTEAIVVGMPCGSSAADSDTAVCPSNTIEAAAFSPLTNSWRSLPGVVGPQSDAKPTSGAVPLEASSLGWTGSQAVFSFSQTPARQLMLINPVGNGESRFVDNLDLVDAACVAGGDVIAIETGQVSKDGVIISSNSAADAQPLRTYILDEKTLQWQAPIETNKPDSMSATYERVYCSAGQIAYVPIQRSVGFDSGGLWWNSVTKSWDLLPSFGKAGFPGEMAIADIDGTHVAWLGGSGQIFFLKPGATDWVTAPAPIPGTVRLQQGSRYLVVDPTAIERPPAALRIGYLDPLVFLAQHAS